LERYEIFFMTVLCDTERIPGFRERKTPNSPKAGQTHVMAAKNSISWQGVQKSGIKLNDAPIIPTQIFTIIFLPQNGGEKHALRVESATAS
jgi:hypothetical protein